MRPGQYPSMMAKLYEVGNGRVALVMLVPGMTNNS